MKTMGFTSLRIVDSEAHLQPAARWVAHGAGEILRRANVRHAGTGAGGRGFHRRHYRPQPRAFHYYCTPPELLAQLSERKQWVGQAALVFGREDSGLTNEELALADLLTGVPMQADYPSLNLGQAVMVYCYQLASLMGVSTPKETAASEGQLKALRRRADALLNALEVGDDQNCATGCTSGSARCNSEIRRCCIRCCTTSKKLAK